LAAAQQTTRKSFLEPSSSAGLTLINLRRTLEIMLAGFDAAFAQGKELVADFRANEKFHLSPTCQEQEACREQQRIYNL